MNDEFSKILSATNVGGFLRAYVEHTRNMEAPTSFHFFTGLALLGAVLKRRVYFDQGGYTLFCCYQVLLAGPAGKVKKTTAAEYGIKLGRRTGLLEELMSSGSPEALWKSLSLLSQSKGGATGILYSGEMANLVNKRDYNSTMIEMMMQLFDCPAELPPRITVLHGLQPMKNVAVTALFCSNETMLADAMPGHTMKGGLPSRMIMVYEENSGGRRIALPKKRPKPPTSVDDLVAQLTSFRYVTGEATLTSNAEDWFEDWYENLAERQENLADENLEPFYSRYGDHMLRLAMGLAVSDMVDPMMPVEITLQHFHQAEAILEYVLARLPDLYRMLALGPFGKDYRKALRLLNNAGGRILAADFSRNLSGGRLTRKQTIELLDTLVYNGDVSVDWGDDKRQYVVRSKK